MKKFSSVLLACLFLSLLISTRASAQQGSAYWETIGNTSTTGQFIGTLSNEPLIFKTNSAVRLKIKPNGDIVVKDFDNHGFGYVKFDNDGKLIPVPFTGNIDEVLTNDGSFHSITVLTNWKKTAANDIINLNTGNVGIGVIAPTEKLHVVGNIMNDGYLLTRGISIIGRAQGEHFSADTMRTALMMMDSTSKIEGETRIVGSASVSDKLGIGTKYPTEALEIVGNSRITGNSSVSGTISSTQISSNDIHLSSLSSANSGGLLTTDIAGKIIPANGFSIQQQLYTASPLNFKCAGEVDATGLSVWLNKLPYIVYAAPLCSKVGIGTDNPLYTLDVSGNAHISGPLKVGTNSIFIDGETPNSNNIYTSVASGSLQLQSISSNDQNTIINANNKGKVGIGTTTPTAKLDVVGNNPLQYQFAGSFVNNANTTYDSKGLYVATKGDQPGEALLVQNITNSGGTNTLLSVQAAGNLNFGTVAIGAAVSGNAALEVTMPDLPGDIFTAVMSSGSNSMWFKNKLHLGGFGNPIQQEGDQGIIWSDSGGPFSFNNTSGFVIAPYGPFKKGIRISDDGKVNATDYLINGVSILAGGGASQWVSVGSGIKFTGGNVGIGVPNPVNKLEVCGKIKATDLEIEANWCDYVFDRKYNLASIEEREKFIIKNKHLPNIPSEKEIKEQGATLSTALTGILQNTEELTLYIIEINKKLEHLQEENRIANKNIEILNAEISAIKRKK
jgi:hypothetical protein